MEREKIDEAIAQVMSHCRAMYENQNFEMVSMRGALYTLGYMEDEADYIINNVASRGFDYCLDPRVPGTHYDGSDMVTTYPPEQACYWDPSQLESRLRCLR